MVIQYYLVLPIASIVGSNKVILFGGAVGDINKYNITRDTFILDTTIFAWKKLVCNGEPPSPRAGHACAVVDLLQMVVYGGTTSGKTQTYIRGKFGF